MAPTNQRTKNAIKWSAIEKYSVQALQFVISIILARLLGPSDYGLIAMVLVVVNLFSIINETGLGASLLQKLDRDELDFSSVFISNIILGIILYLIVFFSSPFISIFFNQPELTILIRVVGTTLIINSFLVVQRTKLLIDLDFKTQALASLPALIISGTLAILAALKGLGVWALVIQITISALINLILIWFLVKWHPKLNFSLKRIRPLFQFAYKLVLARFINTIFNQVYTAIIGKAFTASQLGFYNRANNLKNISSNNITGVIQRVSTPMLCEAQKSNAQMKDVLMKFIGSTALLVFPLLFGVFILAKPLIIILLTEKWLQAYPILQMLCPVGILFVINTFNMNVFNATGNTGMALKNEVWKKIIAICIIIISLHYGFKALIASQIIIAFIELFFNTYYTKKQIGLTLWLQLWSLKGVLSASLIMALIVFFITSFIQNELIKLVVGFFVGVISYGVLCWVFNVKYFRNYFNLYIERIIIHFKS